MFVPSATSSRFQVGLRQLRPQQLGDVDLDDDLALEVPARVEAEIGVGRPGEAEDAGVGAASVLVDRPVEAEAAARHVVERRAGADLVEVDPHRLGGVEGADHRAVADPRQAHVPLDSLLIPSHTNICSHTGRTRTQMLEPVSSRLKAASWSSALARALRRSGGSTATRLPLGPSACFAQLRKSNSSTWSAIRPSAKRKLRLDVVDDRAAGRERVAGDPVGRAALLVGVVLVQLDLQVLGAAGQHPPHRADVLALEVAEGRVAEMGVGRVAGGHRGAVALAELLVEALDQRLVVLPAAWRQPTPQAGSSPRIT